MRAAMGVSTHQPNAPMPRSGLVHGLILLKNAISERDRSKQQNTVLPNSIFANAIF
jgi:hypothetical protein